MKGGEYVQNMDFRIAAKMAGVPLWQVAEHLRISEPTLYRRLRKPLDEQERKKLFDALNQITISRSVQSLS